MTVATVHTAADRGKVVFANQLRGLCALCVVLIHYTAVVHLDRAGVAWVVAAPPLDIPVPPVAFWANTRWFDLGKFGVGVFFLISGFVVPFSLRQGGAGRFLLARALRIYPVFWLALLIEGGTIAASAAYWQIGAPYGWRDYLVNGLLAEAPLDRPTVDWVSWTLSVEVKFYLAAALLRPLILAGRVWPLLALAAGAVAANGLRGAGLVAWPGQLVSETMYLGFIAIGVLFHYHYQLMLGTARLCGAVAVLLAAFFVSYAAGPTYGGATLHGLSFGWAVAAFALCYAGRARLRPHPVLDAVAAISYPLYLVHAAFGFTVISFLVMACHVPYPAAAATAAAGSLLLAWAVHRLVERPTVRLGKLVMQGPVMDECSPRVRLSEAE